MGYGTQIAAARKRKHWTQFQLANQLGCSDGYITLLESERKLPSLEICLALSRVTELSPEEERDLLTSVDEARKERDTQKIRTRGMAMIGALRERGVHMEEGEPVPEPYDYEFEQYVKKAKTLWKQRKMRPAMHGQLDALALAL